MSGETVPLNSFSELYFDSRYCCSYYLVRSEQQPAYLQLLHGYLLLGLGSIRKVGHVVLGEPAASAARACPIRGPPGPGSASHIGDRILARRSGKQTVGGHFRDDPGRSGRIN